MVDGSELRELRELAARLARQRQTDILLYSGELARPGDGHLALGRPDRPRGATCLLVLRTLGGSADAAYRLARALVRHYRRLIVYVDDYCKGAGMLLALAAHELVISDFGELGPLDLASPHPVTPGRGESGLALIQGLQALREQAETTFEQYLTRFRSRRGLAMSTRSAIEQASALSVGLMREVFSQIDPFQVAEAERARRMATLYTERLGTGHLKEGALERLLTGYPSHDFVIDREEADDLLRTVRAPTGDERVFLTQLEPVISDRRTQARLLSLDDALAIVESTEQARTPRPDDGSVATGDMGEPGQAAVIEAGGEQSSG
jgi:hypothetical protein